MHKLCVVGFYQVAVHRHVWMRDFLFWQGFALLRCSPYHTYMLPLELLQFEVIIIIIINEFHRLKENFRAAACHVLH